MTDINALKVLEQAATPAPWTADTKTRGDCVLWGPNGQFVANAQAEPHWLPAADGGKRAVMFDVDRRDVELIAAMRNALPALVDELAEHRASEGIQAGVISQLNRELRAAREELAKTRAELAKAQATSAQMTRAYHLLRHEIRNLHRRYRGVADVDSCEECSRVAADHVPFPCATYNLLASVAETILASPATTAEPAAPKADAKVTVAFDKPAICGHGCTTWCTTANHCPLDAEPAAREVTLAETAQQARLNLIEAEQRRIAQAEREAARYHDQDAEPAAPKATVDLADPNACRHCGINAQDHANRWTETVGWHTWVDPGDEVRKTRMLLRRQANAEPAAS